MEIKGNLQQARQKPRPTPGIEADPAKQAVHLAREAHRRLRRLGLPLQSRAQVERRALARVLQLPSDVREPGGEADAEVTREIWSAVRTAVLEAAAGPLRGGRSSVGESVPGRREPQVQRKSIEILDDLTEVHRLAALLSWLDRLPYGEIASALKERYSVEISPPEVGEILQEVRVRLAKVGGGGEALRGRPGRLGCGAHPTALASLIDGESLLKRQKGKVMEHIASCAACSRMLEASRERDRRIGGILRKVATSHPRLADLEEYRTEIAASPTRRHLLERHLGGCPGCRSLMEALADLDDLDPDELLWRVAMRRRTRVGLAWAVLAALVIGTLGWMQALRIREAESLAAEYRDTGLLEERVTYAHGQWPGPGLPRDEDPLWRAGMQAYREGRCGEAAASFEEYVSVAPADPVGPLLLGASLFCDGEPAKAAPALESCTVGGIEGVRQEAAWLLAHTHLAVGDSQKARLALEEIRLGGGPHAEEAKKKLEQLH